MIKHVKSVSVYVTDQEQALEFYLNRLGFEKRRDVPYDKASRWLDVAPPEAETVINLLKASSFGKTPGEETVLLTPDDIQTTYEALQVKGVNFAWAPKREPWGTHAQFRDPDGNTLLLVET